MLRFLPKRSIFHLLSSQTRGLKFVKRIVDAQGNEDPDGQPTNPFTPQVYDLSSAEITEDSLKIDLIQTSMDKLFKKNEQLVSEISQLKEIMAIMTTSVQVYIDELTHLDACRESDESKSVWNFETARIDSRIKTRRVPTSEYND